MMQLCGQMLLEGEISSRERVLSPWPEHLDPVTLEPDTSSDFMIVIQQISYLTSGSLSLISVIVVGRNPITHRFVMAHQNVEL